MLVAFRRPSLRAVPTHPMTMSSDLLDRYFSRISYHGSPAADLRTLQELHRLHLQHIPYENIDVFCHQRVELDPAALTIKMLLRRRGGYCFEQNGLFCAVLTQLGFVCRPNMARFHYRRPQPGGRTHHVNLVEVEGRDWLCDVGFGGPGFRLPLALKPDVEVEQMGETYRLRESDEHGFYLERKAGEEWQPLYTFKVDPALPIDLEMANFCTANSSDHPFRDSIRGTRITARGRITLLDHTFRIYDLIAGTLETIVVTKFQPYIENLRKHLGVELSESEMTLLEYRFPALKLHAR